MATYYINVIDEQGNYELIDDEFMALYSDLDFATMPKLTDEQYLTYLAKANGKERFVNGEFVYHTLQVDKTQLLSQQRQQVRDAINTLRDKKINGGVYVPAIDKWIDTDATAERNILSVKATFDLFGDQEIPWTFADNSVAMINKEKLLVIWQVLMEAKTGNHANALKHKAMVEQVENPLEYDYSDGWTQTYEEFVGAANE